jgi:peroxiredoxin
MAQLRRDDVLFRQRQTEVVILGRDSAAAFKQHWELEQLPMVGLSDNKSQVAELYSQEVNPLKLGRMPAQFLIDPEGIIRYAYYGKSMSDIPENAKVLALLDELQNKK